MEVYVYEIYILEVGELGDTVEPSYNGHCGIKGTCPLFGGVRCPRGLPFISSVLGTEKVYVLNVKQRRNEIEYD